MPTINEKKDKKNTLANLDRVEELTDAQRLTEANNELLLAKKKIEALEERVDKLSRDLGQTREQNRTLRQQNKDLDAKLKKDGPVVTGEAGEFVVSLTKEAAVGQGSHPAHTVIARITPFHGATVAFVVDAIRGQLARARPAMPKAAPVAPVPPPVDPEKKTDDGV